MILIDASKSSSGGVLVLLKFLIDELIHRGLRFHLIKDVRWSDFDYQIEYSEYKYIEIRRKQVLQDLIRKTKAKTILCFNSFPLPFKPENGIRVITYFQNPNLLDVFDANDYGLVKRILWGLKKSYLNFYLGNTSYYLFQTDYVRKAFCKQYDYNLSNTKLLPFFDEASITQSVKKYSNAKPIFDFVYISLPYDHKNHLNLLRAFEVISDEYNKSISLVITCPPGINENVDLLVDELLRDNHCLINLGWVNFDSVQEVHSKAKSIIFPSSRETLGLGLVEATFFDKVIVTSDNPVIKNVIEPSYTFNPNIVSEVVSVMRLCIQNKLPKAKRILNNTLSELICLLNYE